MKLSFPLIIVLIALVIALTVPQTVSASKTRPLDIKSVTIRFERTDATITVDFDFPALMKIYLLLLGSKNLEPEISSIFPDFDYTILRLDQDKAVLKIRNISRFDKGYYLHDSHKFGTTIHTIFIYTPDSLQPREYTNLNSTPNIFYR